MTIRIKAGKLSDFDPLGVGGDSIYRASVQIKRLLEKELGKATSNIFSDPVRDDRNNIIDWYVPTEDETFNTYDELNDSKKLLIWNILEEEFLKIKELSNKLLSSTNETSKIYGELLKGIQIFPGSSEVYVLKDRPLLTFWGFKKHSLNEANMSLNAILPKPTVLSTDSALKNTITLPSEEIPSNINPQSVLSTQKESNNSSFLQQNSNFADGETNKIENIELSKSKSWWQKYGWWIFLLILLIFGIPAILKSCNTDFPLYGSNENKKTEVVEERPRAGEPNNQTNTPKISEANNPPVLTAPPQAPYIPPPPVEVPKLNKENLEQKNLKVFNGNWKLVTELHNAKSGENIIVYFSFDQNGNGRAEIREQGGNVCSGNAKAGIKTNNSFDVAMDPLTCTTGGGYKSNLAQCKIIDNSNKANCVLRCENGPCDADFERK
ncbi:SrfA family protein [Polynucleobacter rarus]|uniref:SrfA family protein n=1 Tax=Polynucleobacter rarus TaxID=556055 RepID=UPI000D3ECEB9|nr:SrfA family protein [Polynucleobacter rarus]